MYKGCRNSVVRIGTIGQQEQAEMDVGTEKASQHNDYQPYTAIVGTLG